MTMWKSGLLALPLFALLASSAEAAPPRRVGPSLEEISFATKHGIPTDDLARIRREMAAEQRKKKEDAEMAAKLAAARKDQVVRPITPPKQVSQPAVAWSFVKAGKGEQLNVKRGALFYCFSDPSARTKESIQLRIGNDESFLHSIQIDNAAEIDRFARALSICRQKVIGWQRIAQANGVQDLRKEIPDADFPDVIYHFGGGFASKHALGAEYSISKAADGTVRYQLALKLTRNNSTSSFLELDAAGVGDLLSMIDSGKGFDALGRQAKAVDAEAAKERQKLDLFK